MGTYRRGWIRTYVGCMSSGKTEELFRHLRRHEIAGKKTLLVKHEVDARESAGKVSSRSNQTRDARVVASAEEIVTAVLAEEERPSIVAIEEVQFFDRVFVQGLDSGGCDTSLLRAIRELTARGINVYCTGLNQDFRGEPFLLTAAVMAISDESTTLSAVCKKCNRDATRSQRLINGDPAPWDTPRFKPGWDEEYEARCIDCHDVPGTPTGF